MSERLDAAIREAKQAIEAYDEVCDKYDREMAAYRDFNRSDPETCTDPVEYLRQAKESQRLLNVWSADSDRKRALLVAARRRLDEAGAIWLEESGLPRELRS